MAPATGKAQPARAISAPVSADTPGRGSRVEKRKAAARSAASCLGETAAAGARACMMHYSPARQALLRVATTQRNLTNESTITTGVSPAQRTASMTMPPPLAHESEFLFSSLDELRAACLDLPPPDGDAAARAAERHNQLTKPPGSLGRLEEIVVWLARWQGRSMPRLDCVEILVFAGNHGVTKHGVSAYPAEVTAQMVANFSAGGAAINQIAPTVSPTLPVVPLPLEQATPNFPQAPAMTKDAFLAAVRTGHQTVSPEADLVCVGEMGIGNTTAAAAIAAALFGGGGPRRAGCRSGGGGARAARKLAPRHLGRGAVPALPHAPPARA